MQLDKYKQDAVCVPDVLIPTGCDMHKWAVVACDQFTSDVSYWERIDALVGNSPSALRLILPECFLEREDTPARERDILRNMRAYAESGLFTCVHSFIFVERTFQTGKVRKGLVVAVDLTAYDYVPERKARIRATEGTVENRLPPRIKIRAQSLLELPHILLLADDPENKLMTAAQSAKERTLYDFDLNGGGGHIRGTAVQSSPVLRALGQLQDDMRARFGEDLLLLVGDGNHSLAAAKKCYEEAKEKGDPSAELKRYALCEIVNLYDDGISFEPIHRAVFGVDVPAFAAALADASRSYLVPAVVRGGGKEYPVHLPADPIEAVAFVQNFLDTRPIGERGTVDYIHGADALRALGERADCATVALPPIDRDGFTEYIVHHGVLPRKTFSLGEAEEKRYYLEARRIE